MTLTRESEDYIRRVIEDPKWSRAQDARFWVAHVRDLLGALDAVRAEQAAEVERLGDIADDVYALNAEVERLRAALEKQLGALDALGASGLVVVGVREALTATKVQPSGEGQTPVA